MSHIICQYVFNDTTRNILWLQEFNINMKCKLLCLQIPFELLCDAKIHAVYWGGGGVRKEERGEEGKPGKKFAHFQSQGKNLAPDQVLCKWELLKDFPFGSWKKEKEKKRSSEQMNNIRYIALESQGLLVPVYYKSHLKGSFSTSCIIREKILSLSCNFNLLSKSRKKCG